MECCTIIVDGRDRFSTTTACLETLYANTPEPFDLIVVLGGVPEQLQAEWIKRFGERATFIFRPGFLNQAQARNIGLRQTKTKFAVLIDNDNFVQPGWLSALLRCQAETGAVMVMPLILEEVRVIHCAGNELYLTYEGTRTFGTKIVRHHGKVFAPKNNLMRRQVDYAEMHCMLVEVEPTLRLGAFDECILEVNEVDSGLTWGRAGREVWFEPASVVRYDMHAPIAVEDIRFFTWRWDMRAILEGYRYFEQKWGIDITEHGIFRNFLLNYNKQIGLLPRLVPSAMSLQLDRLIGLIRTGCGRLLGAPRALFRRAKAARMGFYEWPTPVHE